MNNIKNRKLWLCSMCNGGNYDNIREMLDPINEYIDGIIWVLNDADINDKGGCYLEINKKAGKVIRRSYNQRHNFLMNETFYCGLIQPGDIVIWADSLEYPAPKFVSEIKDKLVLSMIQNNIDCVFYYGKAYVFIYQEHFEYLNSPHWSLYGFSKGFELSNQISDENLVRKNMRPIKRPDRMHFVGHYLFYYLQYFSNHCLLGLEKNGDPKKLFPAREKLRFSFRNYLRDVNVPLTVDGVKDYMINNKDNYSEEFKYFLNNEKIINDTYRLFVLGMTDFSDDHDHSNIVTIK